jgi:aminopeptidase N
MLPSLLGSTIYAFSSTENYVAALYPRGAVFIDELRRLMGDDDFFAFLQDYYRQYSGRLATSADFFDVAGDHTPTNLEALRAAHFSTPAP